MEMKKLLLIATGGTIASKVSPEGLQPGITSEELLAYVPEVRENCMVDTVQPFELDSTNICQEHWLILEQIIEKSYNSYDGFVICHGTDTMAYTAAALSYLIQNNRKPIVVTGAQKPINLEITDARMNLRDSLRFVMDDRAYGVNIVFGGKVIAGTRANYTVHLGSGVVHQKGGAMLHILPVHSQKRGKLFLPFVDEDPKTAEIMSKIVLLAEDQSIKDPSILEQIM